MLPTITLPTVNTGAFRFGTNGEDVPNIPLLKFNKAYTPYLNDDKRIQIFYGGSSSGKSVFLAQRCVYDLLNGKRNYLICRAVGTSIKTSVFSEVKSVIDDWDLKGRFKIHETDKTITCLSNKRQAIFKGIDDVEKLKSIRPARGSITDIWIEEATETDRDDIKQLIKRQRGGSEDVPKRLTMSFNPILQTSWIYIDYFSKVAWADDQTKHSDSRLSIVKTTYKDNKFLTQADIDDLENETNEYFYNVYTLGNWGTLGDVIFTNWETKDLSGMGDQFTSNMFGLDFGFSSDPAAMVATHYDKNRGIIYVYDELYERELTNDILAEEIKRMIPGGYIVCDSAEPKSIAELNMFGVRAVGARKGKDSVNFGIDWLKRQKIIVGANCINMRNELQQYQWKKDKDGNSLKVPIDKNNHLIDALRYAYEEAAFTVDTVPNPFYD